jgi:hypothetical protein
MPVRCPQHTIAIALTEYSRASSEEIGVAHGEAAQFRRTYARVEQEAYDRLVALGKLRALGRKQVRLDLLECEWLDLVVTVFLA